MAEYIFRDMLKKHGVKDIEVSSRGLDVRYFSTVYYTNVVMRELYGIDVSKHVPRELTRDQGQAADLILTMNREQKERAIRYGWARPDRIFVLGEYVGDSETSDIKDPYGGTVEEYRKTAQKIESHLLRLLDRLLEKSEPETS
jgi:protein-tyrosine-phosphatase